MPCYIKLHNVDLYYPSHVYNAKSLKAEVFQWLKLEKKKQRLNDIHALKDLNLEVNEGDRLGIIGLNGAGKSTLLKAIAGIYPIQAGTVDVSGHIRSMFDLSLGFDIESTGRENILYRGLMLGENPRSIREKQEEIIEFAGLEEFIDYPIRSYSSGMLVRLAFSISTSASGEILLLDEIIGAGDASFSKKAQERISGVMSSSKILLLVSHDLSTVAKTCNRVVVMEHGRIIMDGEPDDIIGRYRSIYAN
jgi:lipopolysaccharide transport system ATP-binding protein